MNHIILKNKKYEREFVALMRKKEKLEHAMHDIYAEFNYLKVKIEELLEAQQKLFVFRENLGVCDGIQNETENRTTK